MKNRTRNILLVTVIFVGAVFGGGHDANAALVSECICDQEIGSATQKTSISNISQAECEGYNSVENGYSGCEWTAPSEEKTEENVAAQSKSGEKGKQATISGQLDKKIQGLNVLGTDSVPTLIGRVIGAVMQIIGTIALASFVVGGVMWMSSAGNAERQKKATNIIVWSGLGVITILSSYALASFVFEAFLP